MAVTRFLFLFALIACTQVLLINAADDDASTDAPLTTNTNPSSERSFSIESSNAPNTQYEWDAVQCLSEAYVLHPNSLDTVVQTYAELYMLKHGGGWNVNAGCNSLLNPGSKIEIVVKVTEGAQVTSIALFN